MNCDEFGAGVSNGFVTTHAAAVTGIQLLA
jgi:hypothetical protein